MLQSQFEPDIVQVADDVPASPKIPLLNTMASSSQVPVVPPVDRQLNGTVAVSDPDTPTEVVYVMSALNVSVPLVVVEFT